MRTLVISLPPTNLPTLSLHTDLMVVAVVGEQVGCVSDGVKAGGHSQTKGDTSAA